MLIRKLCKVLSLVCAAFLFCLLTTSKVSAGYKYCDDKIEGTNYYNCGNFIYTYYEDTTISSIIYASKEGANIIYAGEENGVHVFYASGLKFYNRSYDDTSKNNNNLWTVVSTRGKEVFSGEFKDSWLLNDSHEDYYFYKLNRDVYTFRQYVNDGDLYRTIVVYNVDKDIIDIDSVSYDETILSSSAQPVLLANEGINIKVSAKYGAKSVKVYINGNLADTTFNGVIAHVEASEVNKYLLPGEIVSIEIVAHNFFTGEVSNKYKVKLVSDTVTINFSTMSSIIESSSRRILISADAGKGKTLDKDYCWYYWSTSGDDSLEYDDFLRNYANSSYKGSYSEDKGVILRNTTGRYYLYALAKDDDSWVVKKSEGYILNNVHPMPIYNQRDMILIASLAVLAILPIAIYLCIRKKGY